MAKVELDKAYLYGGVLYGPGEAEVSKEVQDAIKARGGKIKQARVQKHDEPKQDDAET